MARYKIGATDGGDAGMDLSWRKKLVAVDGVVLITKEITPEFISAVCESSYASKMIIHATCTGYGGTILEPNVPVAMEQCKALARLVGYGFPQERVVVRIDPIIPTPKGIRVAESVFHLFMAVGFSHYRVSMIDMYPHVRERFKAAGLPDPYGGNFSPSLDRILEVGKMLTEIKSTWVSMGKDLDELRIEACAEPKLTPAIQCGCISDYDLRLLGLDEEEEPDNAGYQRKNCMCYSGKVELLTSRKPCPHGCIYCFWRNAEEKI